jgi:O-antigen ligase
LIAVAALMVSYFWVASLASKVKLVFGLLLVIGLAPLVLPGYIRARFMTFFSASEDSEYSNMLQGNDVASSMGRKEVQLQAVRLTLQNPIFGVGPGEFADVMYKNFKQGQGKFINHATHNSYLQISCEDGIPAVLLFIAAMGVCLCQKPRIPQSGLPVMAPPGPRLRSPVAPEPDFAVLVHYTRAALIFVAVFAITLSFAYDDIMLMAMALMTAATNVVSNEMAANPVRSFPASIRRVLAFQSTKPRLRTT